MSNTTNNMTGDFERSNYFMNEIEQTNQERPYTGYDIFSCPSNQSEASSWSEFLDQR